MTPPTINTDTVRRLLQEHFRLEPRSLTPLRPGAWSAAFAFDSTDGPLVVRFSHHPDDFDRDAFAFRFAAPDLPIPRMIYRAQLGDMHMAITERANGSFLDDLPADEMRATTPSVVAMLSALYRADTRATRGYGGWDKDGNGTHPSWRHALLASIEDSPGGRGGPWRVKLEATSTGAERFDRDAALFRRRVVNMPEMRHVIHSDLLNYNVFVRDHLVSAIIDWGCAMYGDPVYELAWLNFWWPWYPMWHGVDIVETARHHFEEHGADLSCFRERMRIYGLQIGLTHQAYHATTGNHGMLESVARRTENMAEELR